jgi:hypothetical protein
MYKVQTNKMKNFQACDVIYGVPQLSEEDQWVWRHLWSLREMPWKYIRKKKLVKSFGKKKSVLELSTLTNEYRLVWEKLLSKKKFRVEKKSIEIILLLISQGL